MYYMTSRWQHNSLNDLVVFCIVKKLEETKIFKVYSLIRVRYDGGGGRSVLYSDMFVIFFAGTTQERPYCQRGGSIVCGGKLWQSGL